MSQIWTNYDWERMQSGSPLLTKTVDLELNIMTERSIRGSNEFIHGRETTGLLLTLFDQASDNSLSMDIEAAATRMNNPHSVLLCSYWRESL